LYIKIVPPNKLDFYLHKVSIDDLKTYYIIKGIVHNMAMTLPGYVGHLMESFSMKLIDEGMLWPALKEDGEYYGFQYLVWSFHEGRFKKANDMKQHDAYFSRLMMEYYTSVN
jgi:hypothetical protein